MELAQITAGQVVLLLECCPSAAITSVFAVQFGHDESFAAGSVVRILRIEGVKVLVAPVSAAS